MADIVLAVGASHAPGLTGWPDKAPAADQQTVRDSYAQLRQTIIEARLDCLVIVANDHLANFRLTNYPDFTIGLADRHSGPDEWFRPWLNVKEYSVPGDAASAETLFTALSRRGIRIAGERDNLRFDDNISVPVTLAGLEDLGIKIVPILQNCTVPPVPGERECYEVGRALASVIHDDLPAGLRVGLFASGGLSHEPGGPRYLEIDEEFDRWWLGLLAAGSHTRILEEVTYDRMEQAGAGGTSELLSWMLVLGAIGERECEVLGYANVQQWRCGYGAVRWSL